MRAGDDALLQDLLDQRLAPEASSALRRRLETEPDLREAWDEMRRIGDLVRGTTGERAPPDFLTRVRARIDAEQAATIVDAPAEEPGGTVLAFPGRFATVISGLAALLLVGIAMRWMAVDEKPVLGEPRVLESAQAPPPETWSPEPDAPTADAPTAEGSLTRHQPMAVEPAPEPMAAEPDLPPTLERAARPAPGSPSAAPPPTSSPPSAAPRFGPGDAVPPGLRTPHDPDEGLERARDAAARGSKLRGGSARAKSRTVPAADRTWALEAEDLETGRARLALLVGGGATRRGSGRMGEDPALLRIERVGDDVLGSVLLTLDAAEVAALDPQPRAADKEDLDDESELEQAERSEEGKKAATRLRVRVLLVRSER